MKKKFDVDKFIKVLLTPKKYPKWYDKKGKPIIDYPAYHKTVLLGAKKIDVKQKPKRKM